MSESTQDLQDRLLDFERAVRARDHELAEVVLHPDYALVLVHPAPTRVPRERWLAMLDDYVVHAWETREQAIDTHGDVATALSLVQMEATVLGEDRSGLFVLTDTWLRGADGWQVWRRHSSPLSAGRMPGGE